MADPSRDDLCKQFGPNVMPHNVTHMVKLTILVINQDRVSVLYTGHVKDPEGLLEKQLETTIPGFLCIRLLSLSRSPADTGLPCRYEMYSGVNKKAICPFAHSNCPPLV